MPENLTPFHPQYSASMEAPEHHTMEFKFMKFGKILVAFALAGTLGLATSAHAATLTAGSIGFKATTIDADTNDILTATTFTFTSLNAVPNTQSTNGGPTGVFAAVPENTIIGSSTFNTSGSPFYLQLTLGTNTFTATSLVDDTPGIFTRTINLTGLITGVGFDPTPAKFTLAFTQTNGPGNAIGYGGSLAVTNAVPEPASLGLVAIGGLGVLVAARRRRSQV